MPLKSVAIADDDPGVRRLLESFVRGSGYLFMGGAGDGLEAVQLVQRAKPNLILMDLHMPVLDGLEAAKQILSLRSTAVVVLTGDADPVMARQALDLGVSGYMQKPVDLSQLAPIMETAWHRFQSDESFKVELHALTETLETRKVLEKAKGILMEQQGFTEEAAHKMLQKLSQEQGVSLKEICRSVIQVKLVLGKTPQRRHAA